MDVHDSILLADSSQKYATGNKPDLTIVLAPLLLVLLIGFAWSVCRLVKPSKKTLARKELKKLKGGITPAELTLYAINYEHYCKTAKKWNTTHTELRQAYKYFKAEHDNIKWNYWSVRDRIESLLNIIYNMEQ